MLETEDRQRAREVPQDRGERDHRCDRGDRAEQQRGGRGVVRRVGQRSDTGGEDVDVGLDALIGVVDRVVDEASPVVGLSVEPVPGEPVGQPGAPRQHEPLHQEQIQHDPRDVQGGHDARRREWRRRSRPCRSSSPRRRRGSCIPARLNHLEAGQHVVALVAEEHVEANADDHRAARAPPARARP